MDAPEEAAILYMSHRTLQDAGFMTFLVELKGAGVKVPWMLTFLPGP